MLATPMLISQRLTGNVRARPGWFGCHVMQVEVETLTYSACPPMPGANPRAWRERMRAEGAAACHWRDATWRDVAQLGRIAASGEDVRP